MCGRWVVVQRPYMEASEGLVEQMLVLRCQTGDRDAFEQLFGRYQPRLRYFVQGLCGDQAGAEDVLQDVWVVVIRKISKLRRVESFPAWIYRIARNKVYEKSRRQQQTVPLDEEQLPADMADDNHMFSAEQAAEIHKALGRIQAKHREVLILHFLEAMPYKEIAEVVGCRIGTVRSRIYHAKNALRQELGESGNEE